MFFVLNHDGRLIAKANNGTIIPWHLVAVNGRQYPH
jgi:hypothetical protein